MKNKKVSIIIVNYNGKKWLKKCLDSLANQTYKNFEIIFVDNASTDDSVEFVKKNYPQVTVIQNKKNLGFAGGNNLGIKNARGKYILLINNDTWVENDFLDRMIKFYLDNNYDVLEAREASYSKPYSKQDFVFSIDILGYPVKHSYKQFYMSGVCLFFSKELYQKTGGLDNDFFMYFEETDWFWRLNLLRKKYTYVPNLYVHHFGSGNTGIGIKYNLFLWRNQNTLQMLLKNYSWYNLAWIIPLYLLQNIMEIVFFLILLKPKIVLSYFQGWLFNLKNLSKTLKKRKHIQSTRKVSDFYLIKRKMYIGSGKLLHLINYIKNKQYNLYLF